MSGFQRHDRDLSRYSHMSTEELEAILQADFALPEDEESDMEKILYITEVIARRRAGQPTGRYADADAAWESFVENYLPAEEQALFRADQNLEEPLKTTSKRPRPQFWKVMVTRVASIVVAVALALAAGTVTASALGFDFWAWLTAWSQEVFGIQNQGIGYPNSDNEIPDQLAELHAIMEEHGFPDGLLPTYLPDGYEATEVGYRVYPTFIKLHCLLKKNDDSMMFEYTMHLTDQMTVDIQKDEDNPDVYQIEDVVHYIMTNEDSYYAVWTVDKVECFIFDVESSEELINMIDSIYGGQS